MENGVMIMNVSKNDNKVNSLDELVGERKEK